MSLLARYIIICSQLVVGEVELPSALLLVGDGVSSQQTYFSFCTPKDLMTFYVASWEPLHFYFIYLLICLLRRPDFVSEA